MSSLKSKLVLLIAMIFALPAHAYLQRIDENHIYVPRYQPIDEYIPLTTYTYSRYSAMEREIFDLVNKHRNQMGMRSLYKQSYLSEKAEEHVDYMIRYNTASHANFPMRASQIMNRLNAESVGENVAYGYSSASSVVAAWLRSSGHRDNIEGDWTHFGVSAKKHPSTGRYYFTMMFARL